MQHESPHKDDDQHYIKRFSALKRYVLNCAKYFTAFQKTRPVKVADDQSLLDLEASLSYFQAWHDSCNAGGSSERRGEFIPHNQCFYDIKLTVAGTCTFVRHHLSKFNGNFICLSKLNQDCCEHHFQHLRSKGGYSSAVNASSCASSTRCSQMNNLNMVAYGKGKGNTGKKVTVNSDVVKRAKRKRHR